MLKDKIKYYRELKQLTQEQLAGKINVSRSLIAKWEQGRAVPSVENLEAICNALEIRIDDIVPYSTVVETSRTNRKKINVILIVVAIILAFLVVWIVFDNVDRTNFKRDLTFSGITIGKFVYKDSSGGHLEELATNNSFWITSKQVDAIEGAIKNHPKYRGTIIFKENRINNLGGTDIFVGKECYVLADGWTSWLVVKDGDKLYFREIHDSSTSLYGEIVPGKVDIYGEEYRYQAKLSQHIIKNNKRTYECGVEYEPAYTIEEMNILYADSSIDESGKCLTIKNVLKIGFIHGNYSIEVHYLENGNITFNLLVGEDE